MHSETSRHSSEGAQAQLAIWVKFCANRAGKEKCELGRAREHGADCGGESDTNWKAEGRSEEGGREG
jgi:hypothetical protein